MNTKIKMMMVSLVIGAAAFTACAQDNDRNGPPPGGPGRGAGMGGHRPPMPAILRALDANHDGVIDADEIANASAALKTLDKNGDGKLTTDEYLGKRPGPPADGKNHEANAPADDTNAPPSPGPGAGPRGHRPPAPAIVQALDANHDGVIDADEIANAGTVLKTLDKNGDGKLTHDEFMGKRPSPPRHDGNNDNDAGGPPPNDDAPPMEQ